MKKLLLLLVLLTATLFGHNYNELLIRAQSSIFPKILLLDKKLENKLVDGKVVFTIVCEPHDLETAEMLRSLMNEHYQNRLGDYALDVNILYFSDFTKETKATAIYVLNSDADIDHVTQLARSLGCVTFSYDIVNLKHGVLLSLMVEKSTVLYLNRQELHTHNVDFVESLYHIVRIPNI